MEYSKHDRILLPRLYYKIFWLPSCSHSLICSDGSQLTHCELPCGDIHVAEQ